MRKEMEKVRFRRGVHTDRYSDRRKTATPGGQVRRAKSEIWAEFWGKWPYRCEAEAPGRIPSHAASFVVLKAMDIMPVAGSWERG